MRPAALLVILALTEAGGAPGGGVASLESTWRAFRVERPSLYPTSSFPDDALLRLATRAREEEWGAARLANEAGRELDVPSDVAALLFDGYLSREIVRVQRWRPGSLPTAPSEVRGIRSLYERANGRRRGNEAVLCGAVATYAALFSLDAMPDAPDAIWALASTAADPGRAALAALRRSHVFDVRLTLPLLRRVAGGIESLPELRDLAEVTLRPSRLSAAAFGAAAERARSHRGGADPRIRVDLAAGEIGFLLDRGLAPEAMAEWDALDEGVRAELLRGEGVPFEVEVDGGIYRGLVRDLRRELAAADAVDPHPGSPRGLTPPDDDDPLSPLVRALHRAEAPPSDPFGLFRDRAPLARERLPHLLAYQVEARFARVFGYPEIGEQVMAASRRRSRFLEEGADFFRDLPLPSDVSSREAALAVLEQVKETAGSMPEDAHDAAAAAAISRSLARPPLAPFRVVQRAGDPSLSAPAREEHPPRAPDGFGIVRCERVESGLLAVALSQALDPSGETSGGGYWLLKAGPGALAWGPPVYTGLRQYRPWVVRSSSSVPLTDGRVVRLEVDVQELAPFHRVRRGAEGLVLEATWEALERDSDGDGVPDLVEERLLTLPDATDTDGDGESDSVDALPHVMEGPSPDRILSEAVTATVTHLLSQHHLPAAFASAPTAAEVLRGATGSPRLPAAALFVVAPRRLFRGLRFPTRIAVFGDEEWRSWEKKFGPGSPTRIDLFALDHGRRRGIVRWSDGWRWGVLYLERVGDHWNVAIGSLTMT